MITNLCVASAFAQAKLVLTVDADRPAAADPSKLPHALRALLQEEIDALEGDDSGETTVAPAAVTPQPTPA